MLHLREFNKITSLTCCIQYVYNPTMIRTQIYIPEPMHRRVSHLAQAQDTSIAEIVRTLLESSLKEVGKIDYSGKETLRKIASLKLKGGPADLSANHNYYLYGGEKTTEE